MADIKQAAEWMQEGKKVRRTAWGDNNPALALAAVPANTIWDINNEQEYGFGADCIVNAARQELEIYFSPTALLAEDWEIAQ